MEIILIILVIVFIFIFLTGKSGVGIKSSLVKEIRQQCAIGIGAPANIHPSISLEEAHEALRGFDANNVPLRPNEYSFWALVSGTPCHISVKKEIPRGIKLIVTRAEDQEAILMSVGMKPLSIPNNLRSI